MFLLLGQLPGQNTELLSVVGRWGKGQVRAHSDWRLHPAIGRSSRAIKFEGTGLQQPPQVTTQGLVGAWRVVVAQRRHTGRQVVLTLQRVSQDLTVQGHQLQGVAAGRGAAQGGVGGRGLLLDPVLQRQLVVLLDFAIGCFRRGLR